MSSWKRIPPRAIGSALALAAALALAGCAGSPSPLMPASANATTIYELTVVVFLIAAIVFVVVEGLLLWSVIRFSRRKISGEPEQIEGNVKFEIAWTAAPAIVLLIVFVASLQAMLPLTSTPSTAKTAGSLASAPSVAPGGSLHIRAIGHQWWWEFDYPDYKVVTANELHIPVNTAIAADIEAIDVIHSFWVPQLGGKTDAIPGHTNHTWFQANEVGTFHGQCAEFCGIEHANMRFTVVVEPADKFQAWIEQQQAPVAAKSGDAAKGEQVFMTGPCIGCHTVDGTKAQGKIGPNLTHFASRSVFAGATQTNNTENLRRWLTDPQQVKPGNLMKIAPLTPEQIDALIPYLQSLK